MLLFSTPSVTSLELRQAHLLEPSKWCCAPQLATGTGDFTGLLPSPGPGGHGQLKCPQKDIWGDMSSSGSREQEQRAVQCKQETVEKAHPKGLQHCRLWSCPCPSVPVFGCPLYLTLGTGIAPQTEHSHD